MFTFASTVCSPSERNSTILAAPVRPPSRKSSRASSKPSEIEVGPSGDISSIPALISASLYDHGTRVVAFAAKDTTEKRVAFSPRENMCTSSLAKAFTSSGPTSLIEPLSSITREKSTWYAQGGLGEGGGGEGDGGGGEGDGGGGEGDDNAQLTITLSTAACARSEGRARELSAREATRSRDGARTSLL